MIESRRLRIYDLPEFKCCSSSYVFWRFIGFKGDKEVGDVLRRV